MRPHPWKRRVSIFPPHRRSVRHPNRRERTNLESIQSPQTVMPITRAPRLDGRTMRRSGRTVQFATRVSPDFDERVRQIAMRDGMLLVEVLERALEAYEQSKEKKLGSRHLVAR